MSVLDLTNVTADLVCDFSDSFGPFTGHNTPIFCNIYLTLRGICVKSASWIIFSMAVERFYATYYPFVLKDNVNIKLLTLVTIGSGAGASLSTLLGLISHGNVNGFCFEQRPGFSDIFIFLVVAENMIFHFILPCILTAVFNGLIVVKLKRRFTNQR